MLHKTWRRSKRRLYSRLAHQGSRICARGAFSSELLSSLVFLIVVAGVWCLTCPIPANDRVTELASVIATREIERLKAQDWKHFANSALDGTCKPIPEVSFYDQNGNASAIESNFAYKVSSTIRAAVDRDAIRNNEDVREIAVKVQNYAGTRTYATQRALVAVGGF